MMIVDERNHGLDRWSSSAIATYALAVAQDLVGLPSSRFSRSRGFDLSAMSVGTPVRCPLSTSAFLTQTCSVYDVQPILAAMELTVAQRDVCSLA